MEGHFGKIGNVDTAKQKKLMDALLEEDIKEVCDLVDTFLEEELRIKDNTSPSQEEVNISPPSHKPCYKKPISLTTSLTETASPNATTNITVDDAGFKNKFSSNNEAYSKKKIRSKKVKSIRARPKKSRSSNAFAVEANHICIYCYKSSHMIFSCKRFHKLTLVERIRFIENEKLCYSCLGNHLWENCQKRSLCQHCQASHNSILCLYSAITSNSVTHDYSDVLLDQKHPLTPKGSRSERYVAVDSKRCLYCHDSQHAIFVCPLFLGKRVRERRRLATVLKLCYLCLGKHTENCPERYNCFYCQGNHHSLLCFRLLLYPS